MTSPYDEAVMLSPDAQDRCPLQEWGCTAAVPRPTWHLLSQHPTSDGDIEYCQCSCNAFVTLQQGQLAKFTGPSAVQH